MTAPMLSEAPRAHSLPTRVAGGCHCGAVRFSAMLRSLEAIECNCSMCTKKALLHVIVAAADFTIEQGARHLL